MKISELLIDDDDVKILQLTSFDILNRELPKNDLNAIG